MSIQFYVFLFVETISVAIFLIVILSLICQCLDKGGENKIRILELKKQILELKKQIVELTGNKEWLERDI